MAASPFIWYELMTTDVGAAEAFYTKVVGWKPQPFGGEMPYTIMNAGERGVGGLMAIPEQAAKMGARPAWVGYIYAADVDKATNAVRKAGGQVYSEPTDIPNVGRFSTVTDPHGATFMLMAPEGPDQPPVPPQTPGHIGWHELFANDWKSAFEFYSRHFGWTKTDAMDMGPDMGTYQMFATGGDAAVGGVMTKTKDMPAPMWVFYFNVPGIDAAAKRVTDNKGKIIMGPMEVPGGSWVLQGMDPQGALFALVAPKR
jgi:uncharacterized protein